LAAGAVFLTCCPEADGPDLVKKLQKTLGHSGKKALTPTFSKKNSATITHAALPFRPIKITR
jgi:hypothetical protein